MTQLCCTNVDLKNADLLFQKAVESNYYRDVVEQAKMTAYLQLDRPTGYDVRRCASLQTSICQMPDSLTWPCPVCHKRAA